MACAVGATSLPAGASTTAASTTAENTLHPGGPLIHPSSATHSDATTTTTISLNWSGYAVTGKKPYNYVTSTFVQPTVTCPGVADQDTSNWVGLDGYNDQTVEQDGTAAWCGGPNDTTPKYEAWYEMVPAKSVNVFAVHPGDIIQATVSYSDSAADFTLTVSDLSTGKSATDTATCASCARASAEWIIERPAGCNASFTKCFLFALADFGTTTMNDNLAGLDHGTWRGIESFTNNYPIFMVAPLKSGGFITLDTVGPVSSSNSFTATWDRSGHPTPIQFGPNR
jgi:hypothetical protein